MENVVKKDYIYTAYYLRLYKGDIVSLEILGVSMDRNKTTDICKDKKEEILKEFRKLNKLNNETDFVNYTSENCIIKNNESNLATYNFSLEDSKEDERFFVRMDKVALK